MSWLYELRAQELCAAGAFFFARDWCPATSSNFSARLGPEQIAITISGRHKGELTPADIMCVDLDGKAVGSNHRPSAETLLHTQLYRHDPAIGAVLHTHSANATVLSRIYADDGEMVLEDQEILKALSGIQTHAVRVQVPIFPNTQNIPELAAQVEKHLARHADSTWGYCIAGHGLYTWGADVAEARRHVEAFEFLFDCELKYLNARRAS